MAYIRGHAKRVVLGISGGVDSAVSALLLKQKGYEVIGVFMRNWDHKEESGQCSQDKEAETAEWVCNKLQIPFKEISFVQEYWNSVFMNLINNLENGFSCVPDILCNRHIKFDKFLEHAKEKYGTEFIATGHYARTSFGDDLQYYDPNKRVKLLQAIDRGRDQTFFLSQVPEEALRTVMFPLGDLLKDIVRKVAHSADLVPVAEKKSSSGICFIGERNFAEFIRQYIDDKPGNFIDIDTGEVVGEHKGIHLWTIGQNISIGGCLFKYFVQDKDSNTGNIKVAAGHNHPSLFSRTIFTEPLHWINRPPSEIYRKGQLECSVRCQQIEPLTDCVLKTNASNPWHNSPTYNDMTASVFRPIRALTPGQFAVFYKGDECLGSGRITRGGPSPYIMNDKNCRTKIQELRNDYLQFIKHCKNTKVPRPSSEDNLLKEKLHTIYQSVL